MNINVAFFLNISYYFFTCYLTKLFKLFVLEADKGENHFENMITSQVNYKVVFF
jgi:hypothetical protein